MHVQCTGLAGIQGGWTVLSCTGLSCALPSTEHPWAVSHAGIMPPNVQDHHTGLRSGQGGPCSEHPNMEAGLLEPPSSGIRSGLEMPRTWRIRGAVSFLL